MAVGSGELTRFVAYAAFFVAATVTTYYAVENRRRGVLGVEIWRYVILAMLVAVADTVVGGLETVTDSPPRTAVAFRLVLGLFFIVLLSLAMRELYYQLPHRAAEEPPVSLSTARLVEAGFMFVLLVEFAVVISFGLVDAVLFVQSLGSLAFAVYGISFAVQIRSDTMSSGTVVDVMLVHVIAVLTCFGAVGLLQGGALVGVPPVVVESVTSVFLVMAATFLMTLAVRLKQNADTMAP